MEKSRKPKIRFKGFTDDWEQRKLVELLTKYTDEVNVPHNGYERLGIRSHAKGTFHSYVSEGHELQTGKMHKVAADKFIVNITFGWEHAVAVTDKNDAGKLVSHRFPQYSLSENLYSKFFKYIILDDKFKHHLWLSSPGGAGRNRVLKLDEMLEYKIKIPNVQEQQKIAEVLMDLDHLIILHQRKLDKLVNVKKSMLEKMFPQQGSRIPEIRFCGFTDDWEQRKLEEIVQITMGQSPDGSTYSNEPSDYILIQGNADLLNGWVSPRIWTTQITKKADAGDLIMSVRAPAGSMGKTAYDAVIGRGVAAIKGNEFIYQLLVKMDEVGYWKTFSCGSTFESLSSDTIKNAKVNVTLIAEQTQIGLFLNQLDSLITLHQCEPKNKMEDNKMLDNINNQILFCDYYEKWIKVYKEGAIRKVTLEKYYMTHRWLKKLIPELKICEMTRINYQQLLNDYALYHERQTTMDFHHQLKGAILDAVDEGLLDRDPTRKAIIKGKTPAAKKIKYINQFELHTLLNNLNLKSEISWDWFILIVAKTGLRFSEALALTPKDFDFGRQSISVSKTWDYKGDGGFLPTKNKSSVRKVQIDWQTVIQFSELIKGLPEDKPIFVNGKVYNSTVNDILARYCKKANVPVISVHGLRHTHASLLLFAGVSIASVARRLGHSSMNTTQKTYLHIIQELESQDVDLVMRSLSGLS